MNDTLIAITTYNQADYTDRCLATLRGVSATVICIDDMSSDHTREICEKHGVEFVTRKEPKGVTYSWNCAYRYFLERDFSHLIISNNDVLFPNGAIDSVVEMLQESPCVSVMSRKNEGGWWSDNFAVESYHGIASSFVDDERNFQKVQDIIGTSAMPSKKIKGFSGFCFGVNRHIADYAFSTDFLFDPLNVNVHQEEDLMERLPYSELCCTAFVYHYKGVSFKGKSWRGKGESEDRNDMRKYRDDIVFQNKTIVFSSVADTNNVDSWLHEARLFDVCINFFGNGDFATKDRANYFYRHKGYKFANFLKCIQEAPSLLEYDYFLFIDDDILIRAEDIDEVFRLARTYGLDACQPALARDSFVSHEELMHQEGVILEYTNFVEVQCMCLSKRLLELCLPYVPLIITGWGLDAILWKLLGEKEESMAVLHAVQMTHPNREEGALSERVPFFKWKSKWVEWRLGRALGMRQPLVYDGMIKTFGKVPVSQEISQTEIV